jgi:hypothetical protein
MRRQGERPFKYEIIPIKFKLFVRTLLKMMWKIFAAFVY